MSMELLQAGAEHPTSGLQSNNRVLREFMADKYGDTTFDLTNPSTLTGCAVLTKDTEEEGYKLVSMETFMNNMFSKVFKDNKKEIREYENVCKDFQAKHKNLEGEDLKAALAANETINDMRKRISLTLNHTCMFDVRQALIDGRIARLGSDGEVNLLCKSRQSTTVYNLKAIDVEREMPEDGRSNFRKFIDSVKNFFGMRPSEEYLGYMKEKNLHDISQAQQTVMAANLDIQKEQRAAQVDRDINDLVALDARIQEKSDHLEVEETHPKVVKQLAIHGMKSLAQLPSQQHTEDSFHRAFISTAPVALLNAFGMPVDEFALNKMLDCTAFKGLAALGKDRLCQAINSHEIVDIFARNLTKSPDSALGLNENSIKNLASLCLHMQKPAPEKDVKPEAPEAHAPAGRLSEQKESHAQKEPEQAPKIAPKSHNTL